MDALTSPGTTSPLYNRQQAMYFPKRGSHLTIWFAGSKTAFVISTVCICSWYAFSVDIMGAKLASGKWILGYGTRFVWNSFRSTFSSPKTSEYSKFRLRNIYPRPANNSHFTRYLKTLYWHIQIRHTSVSHKLPPCTAHDMQNAHSAHQFTLYAISIVTTISCRKNKTSAA